MTRAIKQVSAVRLLNTVPTLILAANDSIQAAYSVVPQFGESHNKANLAFAHANAAFISANNVAPQIEPAFLKANSAYGSQNVTGTYANNAYIRANNSLNANVGGTITGDVTIHGNLVVSGSRVEVNTANILLADNIITLNSDLPINIPPTENTGIEVNRGNSPNVSILWNETTDSWTFTNDGTNFEVLGGGSAGSYANSGFIKANSAYAQANSASLYANGAFIKANAAFTTLNTNPILNRGEYIQANNTINFNVSITANGSDIAGGLSPFLLMGA
jgi:hypothetical protein